MTPNIFYSIIYNILTADIKAPGFVKKYTSRKYKTILDDKKDTPVISRINKQFFLCPINHQLKFHQRNYPLYDRQLYKLCLFLQKKGNNLSIIDVGANIGDTVLNIGNKKAYYLCIEGNPNFAQYIKYNLRHYNYSLECVYLSDSEDDIPFGIEMSNGTSHLVKAPESKKNTPLITLDRLLELKYSEQKFDLIKIDTDGFDFKIIRGSIGYIKKWHPLLYFEWDKKYCLEQNENPVSIFSVLDKLTYSNCILFNNFGNPLTIIKTNDTQTLYTYINNTLGDNLPYYYDVLAIPDMDYDNIDSIYNIFRQ